jgi:hypothetical protein
MRGSVLAVLLVLPAGLVACSTTDAAAPAAALQDRRDPVGSW